MKDDIFPSFNERCVYFFNKSDFKSLNFKLPENLRDKNLDRSLCDTVIRLLTVKGSFGSCSWRRRGDPCQCPYPALFHSNGTEDSHSQRRF